MSNPVPLISIILPTYNRAHLLPRSLRSLLAQSFRDFELIVVDDGSTDNTREVVESFGDPRVVYLLREARGGVAAARNTGVRAARGTYLAFNDSDDEWLLEKLEHQLALISEPGSVYGMALCGLLRSGTDSLRRYPASLGQWGDEITHAHVLGESFAYTQTWLVRREAVVEAGGFDEQLRVWDDWDLLIRLSMRVRIRPLPLPMVISDTDTRGISSEGERFVFDMGCILAKYREHLRQYPRQHAQLEYVYARLLASSGKLPEARQALRRCLAIQPLRVRTWALLAVTLLGGALTMKFLNARQRSGNRRALQQ